MPETRRRAAEDDQLPAYADPEIWGIDSPEPSTTEVIKGWWAGLKEIFLGYSWTYGRDE